mgnify:CR=1 FL=1
MAAIVAGLSGCAWLGIDKNDNTPAKQREALEVPPDLARPAGDDLATVPAGGAATFSRYATKPPVENAAPTASTNIDETQVSTTKPARLERDGALRWLVVQGDPGQAWVKAREYFLLNKLTLSVEDPKTGILESDWIERPANLGSGFFGNLLSKVHSTGLRDKIRVRIERGRIAGTSEIYVAHQGLEEVIASGGGDQIIRTAWQPRAADPEMEAEILAKLLGHFGVDETQAKTQVAAANAERVPLVKGELILGQDDLDAAWRRVGLAMDRTGVIIEDRDRSAGIYYVRYLDSKQVAKRRGVFSWLLNDSDKVAGPDAKAQLPNDRFQVRLKALATGTSVAVFDVKGEPDTSGSGQQLLSVLQQQLR